MGDEKTQAVGKTPDKPPAPVQQQAPKDQHSGPTRAAGQKQPAGPKPANDHPKATSAGQAAAMQQSVGNQQINRIMRAARDPGKDPHQPGLKVSHPDDAAEKEAEAVAKKVTGDQPAHPHDHPGPAPGDPAKVVGDPSKVHGDPDVVHRAVASHTQPAKPQPAAAPHSATPTAAPRLHPAPAGPSPASILDHPTGGEPIPQPTRGTLEAKLKADLSHVVVHHDARSDTAVRALQARAVTRGNHIFLASDASPNDLSLMAHEVAHVLQGDNDTVRRAVRSTSTTFCDDDQGEIDVDNKTITLKTVQVPDWKLNNKANIKWAKTTNLTIPQRHDAAVGTKRDTEQTKNWLKAFDAKPRSSQGIATNLNALLQGADPLIPGRSPVFLLACKSDNSAVIGTRAKIEAMVKLPQWDKTAKIHYMDVDHVQEMQLGGADAIDNYWLLDATANQTTGQAIARELDNRTRELLVGAAKSTIDKSKLPTSPNKVLQTYTTTIGKITPGLTAGIQGDHDAYWTCSQIKGGQSVDMLKAVPATDRAALGLDIPPGANELAIMTSKSGGTVVKVPWDWNTNSASGQLNNLKLFPYYMITAITYDGTKGSIDGEVLSNSRWTPALDVKAELAEYPKFAHVAVVSGRDIESGTRKFPCRGLSTIDIVELELREDVGLYLQGTLTPSIELLHGKSIDVLISGENISFSMTWLASDFGSIGPIKFTEGSITVGIGASGGKGKQVAGLTGGGTLKVALGDLAKGSLTARWPLSGEFQLAGQLDFEKTLFNPAELSFSYEKKANAYEWGLGGHLGIGPRQVPGIKQADITASYQDGQFSAKGDAQLDVPGLQSGSLAITYSERAGISIGGSFGLAPNPVIESGTVAATVSRRPPGNRWALSASGTVKPKIPGVDTTLSASYEDGVFTVEGSVAYARGMLSGSLTVGMTNRPLDPQGHPAGAPRAGAGAPLRPYGGGTLTAKITPWLQGTVGVQLQGDGSVQLMGEIALPDSVNLFDQMQVQKNLLTIGVDIPIVGVAVMGQRIGIFATIQGGLDASASVGPGQLRQLSLRVQYNPEHEDRTQITGGAQLFIPAQAGLRLYVRGALGAGIPVVSAEAGLEIGGQLGVDGTVQAGVTVNWTPKQGLVIDAQASLSAEPSFTFDINGYVKVGADLIFTSVTLYEQHWQLASFRYGSGLRVGVRAPIHYEQGKPFTFSLSDVQFDLPKIDPTKVLTDLVHQIA